MTASAAPLTSTSDRSAADIAVIGAGIVGVACALELARSGMSVLLLDRQAPGRGASYGNAGHMATEQVFPIADASLLKRIPGMLLDPLGPLRLDWRYLPKAMPWFARLLWNMREVPYQASTAGIRALNEASLPAWQALLDSIGRRELLKEEGSLLVHERRESVESLTMLALRMRAQGVPVEEWSRQTVLGRVPALTDRVRGGLFFPATGHVSDPHQVVLALHDAAERRGVRFSTCHVDSARVSEEGVRLETSAGTLVVPRVLVAAGAHSAPLVAGLCGKRVPLDTERGYHLMLPREAERLPVAVTSLERRFIMTPMAEGLRLAGTVEFAGLERPPNMQRARKLEQLAQGLFQRRLDTEAATPWMGFRPSLPDSLPVIDRVGPQGRVWLAFGHHHLGLTQAAITARLVRHFHDDTTDSALPSLTPYRLGRFA
ncbi:NAD(P)/FAD-dependent oxidoreductase [Litchfieldella rifensis]|uniref:NAD(P)/FAD-dependent oxidoreductase n=1 Tax=Litchfieldella rifensis TaxID=762643 RepID=A0ABV7LPI7_9GAMM